MNRRYVVLKQFQTDLSRLLQVMEKEYARMSEEPTSETLMGLYRPVHSLKGLCSMVEEGKDLAKAFHAVEDALSEMLPVGSKGRKKIAGWRDLVSKAVEFGRATEAFVHQKIQLWERFGAHENENRGLLVTVAEEGQERRLWIPITSLNGHFIRTNPAEIPENWLTVGDERVHGDAFLVEFPGTVVMVYAVRLESIITRMEAIQAGVPHSLKDFLAEGYRRVA